jgi:Cu-processing system ATP-binding protein
LDEPTAGLDPRGVAAFHAVIERLTRDDDLTVVLSSHVLSEVEKLCDAVGILQDGHLRAEGPVAALKGEVSEGVHLTVRLADASAADGVASLLADHDGRVRSQSAGTVTVDCPSATVPGLLSDLLETGAVAGYEVTEPGLERVFERALAGAPEADA